METGADSHRESARDSARLVPRSHRGLNETGLCAPPILVRM